MLFTNKLLPLSDGCFRLSKRVIKTEGKELRQALCAKEKYSPDLDGRNQ